MERVTKLALINNFDDAEGGGSKRTARFEKWFSELEVVFRAELEDAVFQKRLHRDFDGFVLSGSPHNVTDIELSEEAWMKDQVRFILDCPKPLLGTCFGHQLLCQAFGAKVGKIDAVRKNNRVAELRLEKKCIILPQADSGFVFRVEESHGQEVVAASLPPVLENVAVPEPRWEAAHAALRESTIQLVRHKSRPIFGTQFHPETFEGVDAGVEKTGADLLKAFEALCEEKSH